MMRGILQSLLLVAGTLGLLSEPAAAHSAASHDGLATGLAHPLGGLDHLLVMLAVGLWAAVIGGRAVWALPVGFLGGMVIGGLLGLGGVALPLVETGILGSVVFLGLAVALGVRASFGLGAATAFTFALFHGYAHGTELPQGAAALAYMLGLTVSTGLRQGLGLVAGLVTDRTVGMVVPRAVGCAIVVAGMVLSVA